MEKEIHEIYEMHAHDLYGFILKMCCNEQLAKDILQDTMMKAMISSGRFRGECFVKIWLCSIAKNIYYDYLKRSENKNIPLEPEHDVPDGENIEQMISDSETSVRIHHLLHRMDEPYREIFSLRVFAELKFSDIGNIFGKSENWASVTFYRAKQKLISMLEKEDLI